MALSLPRGTSTSGKAQIASSRWAEAGEISGIESLRIAASPKEFEHSGTLLLGQLDDGHYVGLADDRHCLTVAGSRAGKGVSLIVPNLILYGGSVLCIDPKGENARLTAARRRAMGQQVYVLDPFGVTGDPEPAAYNPFDDLDLASRTLIDDAALIADSLITDRSTRDPHWDESARDLIKGLILYVKVKLPFADEHHLLKVREILTDPVKLDLALEAMASATELDGVIAASAATFAVKPDKERESVLSTAFRHTDFLDSSGMRAVLQGGPNIKSLPSLRDLRASHRSGDHQGVTIYLCLPAARMPTHARWLRLVIAFALAQIEMDAQLHVDDSPPDGPAVLFLLDEFASLGYMPSMAIAAGLMAGFGVRLWPFLQDLAQLRQHYEKSWETFVGNAGAHVFFGNADLTTLRHVSERLGKVRILNASRSMGAVPGSGQGSFGVSEGTTPLLSTDEVQMHFARRKKAADYLLLLLPHSFPIALRKVTWFRDTAVKAILDPASVPAAPEPGNGWALPKWMKP